MAEPLEQLVEGWTDPIVQQLMNQDVDDAAALPFNLTGCTVTLVLNDRSNVPIAYSGTTEIVTAATGTVKFSPSATDLTAARSPIKARWDVTDPAGKVSSFPHARPDEWLVRKP